MDTARPIPSAHLLAAALLTAALVPQAPAQTLLGLDGSTLTAFEFSPAQGGVCPQPIPLLAACSYVNPTCGVPSPGPVPPGSFLGDIADDPVTDTFFLTDGLIIEQYTLDAPCVGPMACAPIQSFGAPSSMGPLTGMGYANTGGLIAALGSPLLWITDGRDIAGIIPGPPGSCTYTIAYGPCTIVLPNPGIMTDLTWDPDSGSLWASDSLGFVHNIDVLTCSWVSQLAVTQCGLGPGLTGIAFDGATPAGFPLPATLPALYVTDGAMVARIDISGSVAVPTFNNPVACTPTPGQLDGLALTQHGNTYGTNRVQARLRPFGQATTPSANFGVEVQFAPAGANAWFVLGFSWPGQGYFCPPITGAQTSVWVNPAPPGSVTNIGPLPGPCFALPLPIPAGVPPGLEAFVQIVFIPPGGPPAVDATNAVAVTVMLP